MKLSIKWLNDYVACSLAPEKLAHRLTMAGLEVEKAEKIDGDTVFELEITPNRPDCLSVIGLAREVSAVLNKPLKTPKIQKAKLSLTKANIVVEDKKGCLRYMGAVIEDIHVADAPAYIKQRLAAVGLRSINNVVDITNFCLMESGQPLHAFDYDKLSGGKIVVRRAKKGERIITIDGIERELDPAILIIADAKGPVAIAGVMGGKATEVTAATKNILLESAYFDSAMVRSAVRSLGLSSDSSYRFERGVAWDGVPVGAARAASLIMECAGGKMVAQTDISSTKRGLPQKEIFLSMNEINTLLGASLSLFQVQTILKKLAFSVRVIGKSLKVKPPVFRGDIKSGVDLIEEVARVIGYDNLPSSLPEIKACAVPINNKKLVRDSVRGALLAQGLDEAITYSMTNENDLARTQLNTQAALKVRNPLSKDQALMRSTLAPCLLSVALSNFNRGQKDLKIFEIGKKYSSSSEKDILGVLISGRRYDDWRQAKKDRVDFYDIKGVLEGILQSRCVDGSRFVSSENPLFEAGICAVLLVGNKEVGRLGQVAANVLQGWGIKQSEVYFAELDMEWLYAQETAVRRYSPPSEYPAIVLDVSLALKPGTAFGQVQQVIDQMKPEYLTAVRFMEEYLGEKIPEGHRGVVFSLTYQSRTKTLVEDQVAAAHEKICQAVVDKLGAVRR